MLRTYISCAKALMLLAIILLAACSASSKKAVVKPIVVDVKLSSPVLTPADLTQYDLGTAAMQSKNYSSAKNIFSELLVEYPRLAGAHVNLALVELERSNEKGATAHYEKALEINPNNVDALVLRAANRQKHGKFEAAAQDLLLAEAVNSDIPLVHFNLGVIYELYLQDYNLAIEYYENYIDLSNNEDVERVRRWIKLLERK